MERKVFSLFRDWKNNPDRKPLIVTGCRQIGKTYSVKKFVKENYTSSIYVNFEDSLELVEWFQGTLDVDSVVSKLMIDSGVRLTPGKSAIIMDEIQRSSGAMSWLKVAAIDGRFDIIATGSLLGLGLNMDQNRLSPMGYVEFLEMHPMDFEEYLWAMGYSKDFTEYLRTCIKDKAPIEKFIYWQAREQFLNFIIVGGMPAAVHAYSKNRAYKDAVMQHKHILGIIERDSQLYSGKTSQVRISKCLRSVPHQLAKDNGVFEYFSVEKKRGYGGREYGPAIMWLEKAGLINLCYNVDEPVKPLFARVNERRFKIYLMDTGMLMALVNHEGASAIALTDPFANNGSVMENAIACSLNQLGYPLLYYEKKDSSMEIDFLLDTPEGITAIEVKSGKEKRAKSLRTLIRNNKGIKGVKICDSNILVDDNGILLLPLFAASFMDSPNPEIPPSSVSPEEVNRYLEKMLHGGE